MKGFARRLPLLRFWFSNASGVQWLFLALYALMVGIQFASLYSLSGFGRAIAIYIPIFWTYLLGLQLFGKSRFNPVPPKSGLPCAEFLLSRPIDRRHAQLFFASLFLLLIMGPVLALMGVNAAVDPDVCLEFQGVAGRPSEASDKLAEYRAQFPQSTIEPERNPDGEPPELVIPHGQFLVVGWLLESVTLVALETLMSFQIRLGSHWRKWGYGPISTILFAIAVMAQFRTTDEIPEQIFFFFAHHWPWFAIGTVVFAVFALRQVGREASEIEV